MALAIVMWLGFCSMSKKDLKKVFIIKSRKAKESSDLWTASLNKWLELSEHEEDTKKIMRLGKEEWLARKKANKATEEMYAAWKDWKGI